MNRLGHTPNALTRRPGGDIRLPGFARIALTKGISQKIKLLLRYMARSRLLFIDRQLQLSHEPPHDLQRLPGVVALAADMGDLLVIFY